MMINCLCCVSQPAEVWLPTKSSLKGWCPLTAGSRMRSLLKSSRPRWPTALDLFSLMRLCSPSLAIWDGLTPGSTRARDVQKLHLPSLAIWQPCLQDLVPLQCQVLWWTLWCHLRWDPPWWHRLLVLRSARSLALLFLGVGFGILFSSFVVSFVVGVWIVNGFSFVASWIESDHVTMWINDAGWTQVGLMSSGVSNPVAKTAPVPPPPRPILSPEGQILPTPAAKAAAAAMPSQPEAGVLCVICQSVMGHDEVREALWCTHTFHQQCLSEWRVCANKGPNDCPHRCRPVNVEAPDPMSLDKQLNSFFIYLYGVYSGCLIHLQAAHVFEYSETYKTHHWHTEDFSRFMCLPNLDFWLDLCQTLQSVLTSIRNGDDALPEQGVDAAGASDHVLPEPVKSAVLAGAEEEVAQNTFEWVRPCRLKVTGVCLKFSSFWGVAEGMA